MVTIQRLGGMRFVIFVDDHEPAHVHVFGDGEARIDIVEGTVLTNRQMSRRDLSQAFSVVTEHRALFLEAWKDIHG